MYTYDEVYRSTLDYFSGDSLAAGVWVDKYALKTSEGAFMERTPEDMHRRLAKEFARTEGTYPNPVAYERILGALENFQRIVPQGSPMAAVGNYLRALSASNCVVVASPHDSIGGIFRTATELAQLYKRRAGVGVDVSTLRPNGFAVQNAARTTTGPVSFCDLYSYVTRLIGQDGRRGALMLTMDVHHPDIEEFATMKADLKKVTGANISVRLSDEFLEAVEADEEYTQRWPCEGEAQFTRKVRAKKVWDTIVEYATKTAEPGLIFWDRMTQFLPAHSYPQFRSTSTNPCSEICLSPYDSCRLLSLNLTGYVREPFGSAARFDFDAFIDDVRLAVRMADNLVDIEIELINRILDRTEDPVETALWEKLQAAGREGRRIGLGTHGLADMLAQISIKYDTQEALDFCDKLYGTLRNSAYRTSIELAKERGPFPAFNWEIERRNKFIEQLPDDIKEGLKNHGRRNIALLTQAPTGSISLLSKGGEQFARHNISSGVEPLYKISYARWRKGNPGDHGFSVDRVDAMGDSWMKYNVHHNNLLNWSQVTGGDINVPPEFFVEAEKIDWKFRVKLQGVEQRYIDHSISSTINLPRGTSSELVGKIYMDAWKNGLKGVTVYVDGSRDGVLTSDEGAAKRPDSIERIMAPGRPKRLPCEIHHSSVKGHKWVAIVGLLNGEPYELFGGHSHSIAIPNKYKVGEIVKRAKGKYALECDGFIIDDIVDKFTYSEDGGQLGWITRLVSTALRHGTPIEFLVEQLNKEGGVNALNKVLARVLKKYLKDGQKVLTKRHCPSCNGIDFTYQEGCPRCVSCGWTKC